ncbi:dynein light chain Tctex-type 5-B-like isoform X2 [Diabrotica virgifera virgifera]|uniref:Tctex1 domain-containing protein 1-B-like isoform X2 n=1 Tax=Diabrotica virgifera virgifera TaxID=50390 RepID=A0A6P7FAK4_DIAVI|nr:dynein light chain Tctex-type 5-B-like isoform X2 [Diabrotica virgifera virgifera]
MSEDKPSENAPDTDPETNITPETRTASDKQLEDNKEATVEAAETEGEKLEAEPPVDGLTDDQHDATEIPEVRKISDTDETKGTEEAKEFDYQETLEEETMGKLESDVMNVLSVSQDSLEDLVKSSSMQIAKGEQSGLDVLGLSSQLLIEEKKKKRFERAKDVLGEVIDIRGDSVGAEDRDRRLRFMNNKYDLDKPIMARFMNTYKLDSDKPFNHQKIESVLKSVMEEALQDLKYDPEKCIKLAKWASNTIRAKVKQMEFDRYRIISLVTIGEKHNQGVLCTCRFLWDSDRDNYSCYTLQNPFVFGIALCFGLYYE